MALYISDLHLSREQPQLVGLFIQFLDWARQQNGPLYILGDLFDAWLGDDAPDPQLLPILQKLKSTSECMEVYIMHGNRDFLIGEQFCAHSGCRLLDDPVMINTQAGEALLTHGDLLCTDDVDYQKYRAWVRNPAFIAEFLAKTVEQRIEFVRQLRSETNQAVVDKTEDIMDVNQTSVEQTMLKHSASLMIHGHTHRMARHQLQIQGEKAVRWVLGDWKQNQGFVLMEDNDRLFMKNFPQLETLDL